jgi:hypothetical protein
MRHTLTRSHSFRLAYIVLTLLATANLCAAQEATQTKNETAEAIHVIPLPRELNKTAATFKLSRDVRVVLTDARSADDRFAAQDFIDDLSATANLKLTIGRRDRRRTILVGLLESAPVQTALKRARVNVPTQR